LTKCKKIKIVWIFESLQIRLDSCVVEIQLELEWVYKSQSRCLPDYFILFLKKNQTTLPKLISERIKLKILKWSHSKVYYHTNFNDLFESLCHLNKKKLVSEINSLNSIKQVKFTKVLFIILGGKFHSTTPINFFLKSLIVMS